VKVSILAQIEEVERELAHRRQVYPSLVASRSLRQSIAEFQIARLEAVRATLIWLRDNETEIREIMAERRRVPGEAVTIEVISHEESCKVRSSYGRESVYFYYDDNPGRRSINGRDTPETALAKAEAFAHAEREKLT
jgi:hypothetical protein